MSSVMIRCPSTGRAVSTAIETEPCRFPQIAEVSSRMLCPACERGAYLDDQFRLACG